MIHDIKTENELRKLAGLPLKEAEGGSLDNILAKHREAFESVMRGESMLFDHDEFYDELYEHYVRSGEMPYGVAKARDGDPDQWIQEELEREYGDDFATDDGEPMDGDFDSAMASAGMGTDEDYGYYGESKEPKTFREHLDKVIAETDTDKKFMVTNEFILPAAMALKAGKKIHNWATTPGRFYAYGEESKEGRDRAREAERKGKEEERRKRGEKRREEERVRSGTRDEKETGEQRGTVWKKPDKNTGKITCMYKDKDNPICRNRQKPGETVEQAKLNRQKEAEAGRNSKNYRRKG